MSKTNIIAHPENASQVEAIKAFMKALKIKFEISKDNPYDPEFVAKIKKSQQDYKEGKGTTVTVDELNSLWK